MENENQNENSEEFQEIFQDDLKYISDSFLCKEILGCGVTQNDQILHLGSGYKKSIIFNYFKNLKFTNLVDFKNMEYTIVDVNPNVIQEILNSNTDSIIDNLITHNQSAQSFLDENINKIYDWTIITGIFDKNLYGANKQFDFLDKILTSCLMISRSGVIFTFDSSKNSTEEYNSKYIISYLESLFKIYSITKFDEFNYIFSIKQHY